MDNKGLDIIGINELGCGKSILKSLLSCYLLNLTIYAYKPNIRDYRIYSRKILETISTKDDKELISSFIYENNDQRPINLTQGFSACCQNLIKFNNDEEKINFKGLIGRLTTDTTENSMCFAFMNLFNVKITIIKEDSPENIESNILGKCMKLVILKKNGNYIPCTSLLPPDINIVELNTLFESKPFLFKISDNRTTESFTRFPITNFPKISTNLKNELSTEYSSFVKIPTKLNQITAFAHYFYDCQKRWQNHEYIEKLNDCFRNKKTMTYNFNLTNSLKLNYRNIDSFIEDCKEIVSDAVRNKEKFKNYKNLKCEENLEKEFNTIRILCKIFGISLIITSNENNHCFRYSFYRKKSQFRPVFHFYSKSYENNERHLWMLITRRDDYTDNYDYQRKTFNHQKPLIVNSSIKSNDNISVFNESEKYSEFEFLIKMNKVQNIVLENFISSFNEKRPFYMKQKIETETRQLKQKLRELKDSKFNFSEVIDLKIMKRNFNEFEAKCHSCSKNFSTKRAIYSKDGCCFHPKCFILMFKDKYSKGEFQGKKFEDWEMDCPACKNNKIFILNLLKDNKFQKILMNLKVLNGEYATCCSCEIKFIYSEDVSVFSSKPYHCPFCLLKIHYQNKCLICKISSGEARINWNNYVICQDCNIETIISNFIYDRDWKKLKCKKCWINYINSSSITLNNENQQKIKDFYQKNDFFINCNRCNKSVLRVLKDKYCLRCPYDICIICNTSDNNCYNCNQLLHDNKLGVW